MASEEPAFLGFDPAAMPARDSYRLLIHCVAPRPIAFTSTVSPAGAPNLAPFSFFMGGGGNPCSVVISPVNNRQGEPNDTLRNIRATGEFVINVVTFEMRERMNVASANYPYGVSEWDMTGFTPAPSVKVAPARVSESPMAMECRLYQIVPHGEGALAANYVIGEVVYFHVRADLVDNGELHSERIDYIARMGADWYSRADAGAMFEMPRPPRIE